MADPHAMPQHPVVNDPKKHKAHNKKKATNDHDGDEMPMGPPGGGMNDHDGDEY